MPDQQTSATLVQVGLDKRERLMDPQTGSPQDNDQTAHPTAVMTVAGMAHDRNDLVDCGRLRRIPTALVRRDPTHVMARLREPGTVECG
jgi:hypothetical protein